MTDVAMTLSNEEFAESFLTELQAAKPIGDALSFHARAVCPGDDVTDVITEREEGGVVKLGVGLSLNDDQRIKCHLAGTLNFKPPCTYWIHANLKQYESKVGNQVIGIIEEKGGDYYKVNIFNGGSSILNRLAFEGATKRNKPELKRGDVIYAHVKLAHKDLDTELTCVSTSGIKKEWSSGETVYGDLQEGILVRVSLSFARSLLSQNCVVLKALERYFEFECCVGMNGAIWIKAAKLHEMIAIRNAIINSEDLDEFQVEALVDRVCRRWKK